MPGLCDLIEGAIYLCSSNFEKATVAFRKSLEKRSDIKSNYDNNPDDNNDHISAFAMFELGTILLQSSEVRYFFCVLKSFVVILFILNGNFYLHKKIFYLQLVFK